MAETTAIVAKFVSQKISKIRWQPTPRQVIQKSTIFATGSWDNADENGVSVWQLENELHHDASNMEHGTQRQIPEGEPALLCSAHHRGDVTDLHYVNQEQLLVASSLGGVSVFKHHQNSQTLSRAHGWDGLHHHPSMPCPCTGVALRGEETFVSVGEDGRIHVVNMDHKTPTRTIERADSCTLNSVTFLKQSEVATVNSIGQLKVWDVRQSSDQPTRVFLLTGERVPLHCVDKHPTQPHIVATGGQDGTLCIWDMRQDKFPVTLLSAHSADMWELKFHPSHPDNLFSCSEDGSIWHWDRSGAFKSSLIGHKETSQRIQPSNLTTPVPTVTKAGAVASPWLSSEASRQGLDITDLIPNNSMSVNSLDIVDSTLLCGTDGELIYTVQNLVIK